MKAVLYVDAAVGELRQCVVDEKGRAFRILIERWSERDKRLQLGERHWVRLISQMPGGGDWFIDAGGGLSGVLSTNGKARYAEGQLVAAIVAAEAYADKEARLRIDPDPASPAATGAPRLIAAAEDAPFAGFQFTDRIEGPPARDMLEAAIEEGLQTVVPIPGGGDIAIEVTRALTAIDVDTGAHPVKPAGFLAFNKIAAVEIARQLALRSMGGLVVVDFVSMAQKDDRARAVDAFRSALAAWAVAYDKVGAISPAGLCEAVIPRSRRPLADAIRSPGGEREALDALRLIERTAQAAPGKRIRARIGAAAESWLGLKVIDWQAALADRIGRRWIIEPGVEPRGRGADVWADS